MYKLCGGTFFVLLLHSRKSGIERELLRDMLKIFNPDIYIDEKYFKEKTKKFKQCKEHSSLTDSFEEAAMQNKMTDDINDRYDKLLAKMTKFIDKHIDIGSDTQKDKILVKALLEVIRQDESIANNQEFYILSNGKTATKEQLISIKTIYLPSFILGILYYVMMNIKDNREGLETYNKWCPQLGSRDDRKYIANIGENSNRQVELMSERNLNDYYELLYLTGEHTVFYVKRLSADDNYDIANTTIIFDDTIDDSEREAYLEFSSIHQDVKKIKELIDDCNDLICCANKYHGSVNKGDVELLSKNKNDFFQKWLFYPYRFANSSIQEWVDFIFLKFEQSKIIDINNIAVEPIPIKMNITQIPVMNFKVPKVHYLGSKEDDNTSDQGANNNTLKGKNK